VKLLTAILFGMCCVFVFGASVNYGWSGPAMGLPFLVYMGVVATRRKGIYLWLAVPWVLFCGALFQFKGQHGKFFHPALGREFRLKTDVCFDQRGAYPTTIHMPTPDWPCQPGTGVARADIVKKGAVFKVDSVSVSNADMGESYIIHSETRFGTLDIPPSSYEFVEWANGEPIKQRHLTNPVFYFPALLMFWPMLPTMLARG
jgi:hypothetical protein